MVRQHSIADPNNPFRCIPIPGYYLDAGFDTPPQQCPTNIPGSTLVECANRNHHSQSLLSDPDQYTVISCDTSLNFQEEPDVENNRCICISNFTFNTDTNTCDVMPGYMLDAATNQLVPLTCRSRTGADATIPDGYIIDSENSLNGDSFDVNISCASNYRSVGDGPTATPCTSDNLDYNLSGCEPITGMCSGNTDSNTDFNCQTVAGRNVNSQYLPGSNTIEGNTYDQCCHLTGMCKGNTDRTLEPNMVCPTNTLEKSDIYNIIGRTVSECCNADDGYYIDSSTNEVNNCPPMPGATSVTCTNALDSISLSCDINLDFNEIPVDGVCQCATDFTYDASTQMCNVTDNHYYRSGPGQVSPCRPLTGTLSVTCTTATDKFP